MKRHKRWTSEEFTKIVLESKSITQVLNHFKLRPAGANFVAVKQSIAELCLDVSHFTGQGHLKGKKHSWAKSIPLEQILVKDSRHYVTGLHGLKERLIKENLLKYQCSICSLNIWMSKPISLHLDHINGDRFDNRLENLRFLCPNCHSQTDTYCGKNKKKKD